MGATWSTECQWYILDSIHILCTYELVHRRPFDQELAVEQAHFERQRILPNQPSNSIAALSIKGRISGRRARVSVRS